MEKITIKEEDVKEAINRINKNKAIGVDNITMKPIDKIQSLKMNINGFNYEETNKIWKKKITKKQ